MGIESTLSKTALNVNIKLRDNRGKPLEQRIRNRGFFVAVEGIDGCGKSVLCDKLIKSMTYLIYGHNGNPLGVRQPGGSTYAEAIRNIARLADIDPFTQTLIYTSAIYDSYITKVVPYLNDDGIVISDRFTNTLFAYQGLHGGQARLINDIWSNVPGFAGPDLTIYLSLPLETALSRERNRPLDADRYSSFEMEKKIQLKAWYDGLHQAAPMPQPSVTTPEFFAANIEAERYKANFCNYANGGLEIIDATQTPEKVLAQAYAAITRQLERRT